MAKTPVPEKDKPRTPQPELKLPQKPKPEITYPPEPGKEVLDPEDAHIGATEDQVSDTNAPAGDAYKDEPKQG